MSSAPVTPAQRDNAPALSHEEWWALFDRLRLAQQADYAEYGGPVAFFRSERDADAELPDSTRSAASRIKPRGFQRRVTSRPPP